ncbi:MAG TPA: Ig-like domain-containing protein, partial [Solirubrobacter sp.]|nr:Ig-like domain-containing protein [Solirubrobacter sp.]
MRLVIATLAAVLALAAPAHADTTVSGPSGTIRDRTPTFRFTGEAGATFECKVEPAFAWRPCTSPFGTELADGTYTFWVRATDRAGNVETDPPHRTFTIDTSAVDTAIDAGPDGLTNDSTPSFTFRTATTGATYECSLNAAAFALCSSPYTAPKLASGSYVLGVRAVSPEGKADATPAERAFTVDADAPETRITGGPADNGETGEATPTIAYASEPGATFECRLDNTRKRDVDTNEFKPCPAGAFSATLAGGRHTFEVRATDAAGNTDPTPASRTFTVRLCEKVVRFGLIEATGDCLAQVGTDEAPRWESDGDVVLNGLPLPLGGPARLVLTGPTAASPGGTLAVTDITLSVAGVQLYRGGFSWDLPAGGAGDEKELKRIDLAGSGQKLFGMKVEGFAALRLRRPSATGGVYKTILQLRVALPELFRSGPQPGAGGVTGDVAINLDRDGVHTDGLKVAVANAYVAGIGVKSVCLSYAAAGGSAVAPCAAPHIGPGAPQPYVQCRTDNEQDRWDGALAIVLPTPSRTELGLWGGLRAGKLANAGGFVDNLGTLVPLWPGAWLQSARLGVCLDPPPFQIKGGVA